MNAKTELESLRTQHAASCDALYSRHPGQEINRAHYDDFRSNAQLGRATRRVKLAGAAFITKGALVLFTPSAVESGMVHVWTQGQAAIVRAEKISAVSLAAA